MRALGSRRRLGSALAILDVRPQLAARSMPEWRNWQTRRTQNPVRLTASVGSIPSSGTNILAFIHRGDRQRRSRICEMARAMGYCAVASIRLRERSATRAPSLMAEFGSRPISPRATSRRLPITAAPTSRASAQSWSGTAQVADHFYPYGKLALSSTNAKVESKILVAYAGSYEVQPGSIVNVTPGADALVFEWVNPFGSGKQGFAPVSDTTFVASDGTEATFVRSPSGEVTEIIILGNGPGQRIKRTTQPSRR